jgi:hypothetical protein
MPRTPSSYDDAPIDIAAAATKNAGIPKKGVFLLEGEMEAMKQLLEIGKSYTEAGQDRAVPTYQPERRIKTFARF